MKIKNKAKLIGAQILYMLCCFLVWTAVFLFAIGFVGLVIDGICTTALVFETNSIVLLIFAASIAFIISLVMFFKDRKDIFPS